MQAMNTLVRLVLVASCALATARAQFHIPDRGNEYATDLAGVLTPADSAALKQVCDPLIQQGTPVAVLTVAKLADHGAKPEEIGAFANAVYDSWGVGHSGDDRGALIVVSRDDRKVWVALGHAYRVYNGTFQKIIDETIRPQLKQDNYGAGLLAGVNAIRDRVIEPEMTQHREFERNRRVPSNDPLRNLAPYTPKPRTATPVAPPTGQSTTTVTRTTRHRLDGASDMGWGGIVCMIVGIIFLIALLRAIFGGYGHGVYPMHGYGGYGGYGGGWGGGGWGWGGPWGGYYGGGWGSFGTGMMMGSMMGHHGYGGDYTDTTTTTTTTDGGGGGMSGGGFSGGDSGGGGGFSSGFDGGSSSGGGAGGDF